jgi:sulfur-oxidizing protein SoxY
MRLGAVPNAAGVKYGLKLRRKFMNRGRRSVLKTGGGVTLLSLLGGAGLLSSQAARADAPSWNKALFDTHSLPDTMKAIGGGEPAPSKDIVFFQTPDIAENGAVVPVGISSNIPKTESIAILVEKNPNMVAAVFDIPAGTEPSISTRVKMGQSSNIVALVRADGKYYVASKEVKVTLGGCGG